MSGAEEEIELLLNDPPKCPRCGKPALFSARFPHSWENADGEEVHGLREAVLCPRCDRGERAADEILALFAVDEQLTGENLETFGELAAAWVESVRSRAVDLNALDDEHERWRRGEL